MSVEILNPPALLGDGLTVAAAAGGGGVEDRVAGELGGVEACAVAVDW